MASLIPAELALGQVGKRGGKVLPLMTLLFIKAFNFKNSEFIDFITIVIAITIITIFSCHIYNFVGSFHMHGHWLLHLPQEVAHGEAQAQGGLRTH